MQTPIYANKEHEVLVEKYITMTQEFVKDVANESRLANYQDIFEVIINYHNTYGDHKTKNNWHDWLMILPINLSVMTNGFFAGIETKRNAAIVRSYKVILNEMLHDLVDGLEKLEPVNE
jgi:hypothetical protein|tara:strand:- start:256 stop:612 length:357 start_codon:yes stop_codon:yes gene_type:complete